MNVWKLMMGFPFFGRWFGSWEWVFGRSLGISKNATFPRRPENRGMNDVLLTREQADRSFEDALACGLPPHADRPKNWDALNSLAFILERTDRDAAVLEVGATLYSVMLPWLYLYGYRDLRGIDPVFGRPVRRGTIRYENGDITATRFADGSFDAIVCLSVIEHGVDIEAYFRETARLLGPSGVLITSVDYWCDPIETLGQEAYGVPIRIFTRAEMEAMLGAASRHGFRLTGDVSLDCGERAVRWERFGLSFTFACFALEKAGGDGG